MRYPLTLSLPRVSKLKIEKKIPNFILKDMEKQTVPHESTGQ